MAIIPENEKENAISERINNFINSIEEFKEFYPLSSNQSQKLKNVVKKYPMKISEYYLSLMDWEDPEDPIRKMVFPSEEELSYKEIDTITHEHENTKMHGLQHKYSQTALILVSNHCATVCRYCFRKRFVGIHVNEVVQNFDQVIKYLINHPEINNVLLSGGDPLVLPNRVIKSLLNQLDMVPNLRLIRIGSKVPVTFPMRISEDQELLEILGEASRKNRRIHIQTHFNHPNEITPESIEAIDALLSQNVLVQNQTVLLKGVNDKPEILGELLNKLVSIGVNPYYVFQCRPFKRNTSAFQVPFEEGIEIVEGAKKLVNGQGKRFKYCLSHSTGKIEILGKFEGNMLFKYHQAKDPSNLGQIFKRNLPKDEVWLWEDA